MKQIIVTGSGGLIGSEANKFFNTRDFAVIGIDNNMRSYFFSEAATTKWSQKKLQSTLENYGHYNIDIREYAVLEKLFSDYNSDIAAIIHTAAQPSHDRAAKEPITDFTVNANGTLNLLELTRHYCPNAIFIFTSTIAVYGDTPNYLPLIELDEKYEIDPIHPLAKEGIDETMSIDNCKQSIFGASKVAAVVMVQEYGKYFGMKTAVFRGGCLTGPAPSGAELHGFLGYLILCAVNNKPYTIFRCKGKQVRNNIHSKDIISTFWSFLKPLKQVKYIIWEVPAILIFRCWKLSSKSKQYAGIN